MWTPRLTAVLLAAVVTGCATPRPSPAGSAPVPADAGAPVSDFARTDDAETQVLRRRQSLDTLDRGLHDWDQAVVQGRNTRATACATVKKMRFPVEGITRPVVVTVPVELADGGARGEVELVILPDGTVQSCR